jgi:TonB family protein
MRSFCSWGAALLAAASISLLAACAGGGTRPKAAASAEDDTRCPPTEQLVQALDSDYGHKFLTLVSSHVSYPSEALAAGQSGAVRLCARLGRDGVVRDGRVLGGSGYPILDGEALLALGSLKADKDHLPMPADFAAGQMRVWIAFVVNFKPERNVDPSFPPEAEDRPCKDTGAQDGDAGTKAVKLDEWGEFPANFSEAVKKQLFYPQAALDASVRGQTRLCVALDRDAQLLGVSISHSSGSPLLDGASLVAMGMLQLNNGIPKLPEAVRQAHEVVSFDHEIDWKP